MRVEYRSRFRFTSLVILLFMTIITCASNAWATGTSGMLSFTVDDSDLQYAVSSSTRMIGGANFTLSGTAGSFLGYDDSQGAGGIYASDGGANGGVSLTIAIADDFVFDIASLQALASSTVSYVLTYADGSTSSGTLNGISTNSLSTLTPAIIGIKKIVLTSEDYAVFQNIILSNIHAQTYSVTYNGNNNTGGAAPFDSINYLSGATVTVLGNSGLLTRTGYTFAGWNTAANGSGTNYTATSTFSIATNMTLYAKWVLTPPSATTDPAISVTDTGATLEGAVNDNGWNTTITFEYGLTTAYGFHVNAAPNSITAGTGFISASASISGLTCNTAYHFRVSTASTPGTFNGSDSSFTTTACLPGAPTIGTATAGDRQASVAFSAPSSNGGATITGYTVTSTPGNITGTGSASPIVVTGLTNGTAYTFAVTATNSAGAGPASVASNSVTPGVAQTITFNNPGAQNFGTTPTLTATSSSALAVSFTSSTTGVCTITTGGALTFLTPGTCIINADQGGNSNYAAATTVPQSFAVNAVRPGAPTIGTATAGDRQASVSFTPPAFTGGAIVTTYTVTSYPGYITATGSASPILVTGLSRSTAYTFTVTATNAIGTSRASEASNSILCIPAPTGTSLSGSTTTSQALIFNAIANATSGPFTAIAIDTQPSSGQAIVDGLKIIYVPDSTLTATRQVTFTYTLTNTTGTSTPITITVTVTPATPQVSRGDIPPGISPPVRHVNELLIAGGVA